MSGVIDPPENHERKIEGTDANETCADPSSSHDVEDMQPESQADIRQLLERLSESQSAALVYVDHHSEVIFNREARITGDLVGRDQHKQSAIASVLSSSDAIAGYVPEEDLEKVYSVYSPPSCHDRARALLAEKNVLILRGPARWGKWTAALQLLHDVQPGQVAEFKPDVTVADLLGLDLEGGRNFVLDTLPSETLQELTATALSRLSERFRIADCHVVITADGGATLSEAALGAHAVNWNERPDPRQVLESHIRWRLGEACRSSALELADSTQVCHLLDGQLVPGEVDHLAEILVRVAGGDLGLEEGLAQFEASALRSIKEWFQAHDQTDERAFMISIAVLNGSEYEAVTSAARLLSSRIREQRGDSTSVSSEPAQKPRSSRLEEAHARIVEGSTRTEFGRCPVELVVLDNPAYQPCVLKHVWRELDWLRMPVLRWLGDLNQLSSLGDRAKAAAAVGELCRFDFARVLPGTIKLWANDSDPHVRAAAAFALGIPAWDSEHAPRVMKLLHHWGTLRNNWRLGWTAAAAYGGLAGQRFPNAALRELLAMATGGNARLRLVAGSSLLRLLVSLEGEPSACLGLLAALAEEAARRAKTARNALDLFLELLQAMIGSDGSTEKVWPVFLRAARHESACLNPLVSLWRRALNTKSVRDTALGILRTHVECSKDVSELYEVLESIIIELAKEGTIRERRRLHHHLSRWASDGVGGACVARKLLASLESEIQRREAVQ